MNSLVTVYIPTFNRVELLKRAVDSVLQQTYKDIEIIIVDDSSTDDTPLYLERLVAEDSRVKYFIKPERSGACVSRNIAIENATGYFITGLDDDDYFLSTRIEDFLREWELKESNVAFLYSLFLTKNKNGVSSPNKIKSFFTKKKVNVKDLKISNYPGNQIFTTTETLKLVGGFDREMPAWQDLDTWYRILMTTNKYGQRVRIATYVYDISHEHERITKTERHIKARGIFLRKNGLEEYENSSFFLVNYKDEKIMTFLKRWMIQPTFTDIFIMISKLKQSEKNG